MAARTTKTKHDQGTIERIRATIQTGQLLKRLDDHVNGLVELTATQIRAADILLKKTIPDLSSVEHTGEVSHNYIARLPSASQSMDAWQQQHADPLNHKTLQ